jgi:plastocyanin
MIMRRIALVVVVGSLFSTTLAAHHSPVMFDMAKTQTLEGTVVEFAWTNPHSSIQLDVATSAGVERWGVEMGSPNSMVKAGWKSNIVKPGDKVSVAVHPLKSGEHGGIFMSITLADGRKLGGRAAE